MSESSRRDFMVAAGVGMACAAFPVLATVAKENQMYGIIGKMKIASGQRDVVIGHLLEGVKAMPGCLSYIVSRDPADPDAIWITEAWDSKESHKASLSLPAVQQAIARARPFITGFGERFETMPVGGHGLKDLGLAGSAS